MARVAFVAHCLLNQNSRVVGAATCAGVYSPAVDELRARGWEIAQMPCPELAFAGLNRFWQVREQYDTPAFRRHCRRIAQAVAGAIAAHLERGDEIVLIGVDGSPSMGVSVTSSDPDRGGRPQWPDEPTDQRPGRGILVEELLAALERRGLAAPRVTAIADQLAEYRPESDRADISAFLEA
jgi:predicted secreted protein